MRGTGQWGTRKGLPPHNSFHTPSIPFGRWTGTHGESWCSIVLDFSGESSDNRLTVMVYNGFGTQGSLVQIQSSRPLSF
jgi:hypothetical protein